MTDYRAEAFDRYVETCDNSDVPNGWLEGIFRILVKDYYADVIGHRHNVLEIGCGRGYMAKALEDHVDHYTGIDLSPESLELARARVSGEFHCANAFDWLPRLDAYDLIFSKAVLEHLSHDEGRKLLEVIQESLSPGGVAIIQVPNMDWLLAGHERYIDITHQTGYTKESLGQLCRLVFGSQAVRIIPVDPDQSITFKGKIRRRLLKPVARFLLQGLLSSAIPTAPDSWIWPRSIAAICTLEGDE